jgi:hypothetical protein
MAPRYIIYVAVSQTLNLNNSAKLKQSLKIFLVVYQGPRWSCSIKKNGSEKSREAFPLKPLIFPLSSEKSEKSAGVHLWSILYLTLPPLQTTYTVPIQKPLFDFDLPSHFIADLVKAMEHFQRIVLKMEHVSEDIAMNRSLI